MNITNKHLAEVRKEMLDIFYEHFSWLGSNSLLEALGNETHDALVKLEAVERKYIKQLKNK